MPGPRVEVLHRNGRIARKLLPHPSGQRAVVAGHEDPLRPRLRKAPRPREKDDRLPGARDSINDPVPASHRLRVFLLPEIHHLENILPVVQKARFAVERGKGRTVAQEDLGMDHRRSALTCSAPRGGNDQIGWIYPVAHPKAPLRRELPARPVDPSEWCGLPEDLVPVLGLDPGDRHGTLRNVRKEPPCGKGKRNPPSNLPSAWSRHSDQRWARAMSMRLRWYSRACLEGCFSIFSRPSHA